MHTLRAQTGQLTACAVCILWSSFSWMHASAINKFNLLILLCILWYSKCLFYVLDFLSFLLALSMPFNGAMLTNENVLASLDTLTDWRARALSIVEGTSCCAVC